MKKILLVIPALGTVYGGPSKIALSFANALARSGLAVDLVATDANGRGTVDAPIDRWIVQDGYRLRYFARFGPWEYKLSPSLLGWLLRHMGEYDLTHVTSCFSFPVLVAALACRLRGVPYAIAPQGMLEPWALGYKAAKKLRYLRWIERPLVLRKARLIHVLNGQEAANVTALALGPPVVVMPNGIGPDEIRPIDAADAVTFLAHFPTLRGKTLVLFLHRVDPKKGLDILAPAFASAHRQFPQTHLVVAGPTTTGFGPTAKSYFQQAGVEEVVTFTGMLDGALKRGALAAASVFVAPTYSEGFSMSVLEAMAASLPCVLTEGCNFPEAYEANAARVVPIDAGKFAVALSAALSDTRESRAMGARARMLVTEKYTWDRIALQAKQTFLAVLGPSDHASPV